MIDSSPITSPTMLQIFATLTLRLPSLTSPVSYEPSIRQSSFNFSSFKTQFPFAPTSVKALPDRGREDNGDDSSDTTAEDTAQYRPDQTV